MYLRNGFLSTAAKQWMAVCEEQADARALFGLARVAAAHGQAEGAATFATRGAAARSGQRRGPRATCPAAAGHRHCGGVDARTSQLKFHLPCSDLKGAMNFDITSIIGTQRAAAPTRSTPAAGARTTTSGATFAEHLAAVDTIPATPPDEVLDAIGVAADAYEQLAASGRQLHFGIDQGSGKLVVQLHDQHGNVLSSVSPGQALEVAAGGSID